jgi:hypothetical protein
MGAAAAEELSRMISSDERRSPKRILVPGELLKGETVRRIDPE